MNDPRLAHRIGRSPWTAVVPIGLVVLMLFAPGGGASAAQVSGAIVVPPAAAAGLHVRHLVVIVLENEQLSEVWGHGPYERYLAATYGNATEYFAACHPSAPNYLAMVSAETNQCGSDAVIKYKNTSVGDLLGAANDTWGAYAENLPSNACSNPGGATSGLFATRHVPFLYFANVTSNRTFCKQHVRSSSAFNVSVANGTLPTFAFYTPNLCDDGHNGCGGNTTNAQMTRQADTWLRDFLSPILNHTGKYASGAEQTLIAHTAFVVLWDEALGNNAGFPLKSVTSGDNYAWCSANGARGDAVCGGHVYLVVVSPYSLGRSYTAHDGPYAIPAMVEWLFHLKHLNNPGKYDSLGGFAPMKSLFSFTRN